MTKKEIENTEEYHLAAKMQKMWRNKNPGIPVQVVETARRLIYFRKENTEYSLKDIEEAVIKFLSETDKNFIGYMKYFIWKNTKTNSRLLTYLELIKEEKINASIRKSITNTMQ